MEQTLVKDWNRLANTPHEAWTLQDLEISELVQLRLIREGYALIDVHRLKTRHRMAANRLLLSEHSPAGAVLAAQRVIGGATC